MYNAIFEKFFEDPDSQCEDYTITLVFEEIMAGLEVCRFENITADKSTTTFSGGYEVDGSTATSLREIFKYIPEISRIVWKGIYNYNQSTNTVAFGSTDETDISGFDSLTYFECSNELTDDECAYILSLYPNCEIVYNKDGKTVTVNTPDSQTN